MGFPLQHRLDSFQERLFGPLDAIHRTRFQEIEEDEFVLWGIFASIMCANDAPSTTTMRELDELRDFHRWPQPEQVRALGYYRACLLKKVMREPGPSYDSPPWIVSKNPAFTHKVPQLLQVFPDARFVYLVRSPLESIPSRLNLIQSIWRQRFPEFQAMRTDQVEMILADSVRNYLAAETDLVELPEDRCIVVRYCELVADPRAVVTRIYGSLDLPGSDASLCAALEEITTSEQHHVSQHLHTPEEFGITESRLRQELSIVFDRYGF